MVVATMRTKAPSSRSKNSVRRRRGSDLPKSDVLEERLLLYNFSGQSWTDADLHDNLLQALARQELEDATYVSQEFRDVALGTLGSGNWYSTLSTDDPRFTNRLYEPVTTPHTVGGGSSSVNPSQANNPDVSPPALPAGIELDAATGVLRVTGSEQDDNLTLFSDATDLHVWLNRDGESIKTSFAIGDVTHVAFDALGGNDRFHNTTDIASTGFGGAGDDVFVGGRGQDLFFGGEGNDYLHGNDNNDELNGGQGDDHLFGHAGEDVLLGGLGADVLSGGLGDDELLGEEGADHLNGGEGVDFLGGGDGDDVLLGGAGGGALFGDEGDDVLHGGADHDVLVGGSGDDRLFSYAGDDILRGEGGNDALIAGDGADDLDGGQGEDRLLGLLGDDKLVGGPDRDYLDGGAGVNQVISDEFDHGPSVITHVELPVVVPDLGPGVIPLPPAPDPTPDPTVDPPADATTPITAELGAVDGATTRALLNSVEIVFSAPVEGLDVGDFTLTLEHGDGANRLSSEQTLTSTDGIHWTLGNLAGITSQAGAYHLTLTGEPGAVNGLDGAELAAGDTIRFVVLPEIKASDDFLRMIVNSGHHFWDHERFTNFNQTDGDSYLTLGTRINYHFDSEFDANLNDPFAGTYADTSQVGLRDRYESLYNKYKEEHPDAVVGSYVAGISLKDAQRVIKLGHWPPDTHDADLFDPDEIAGHVKGFPINKGSVELTDPEARDKLYEQHVASALGLGERHKQDIIYFDEVGYTKNSWQYNVDIYSRVKEVANDNGVLTAINLGGWGWADPFSFVSDNIVEELTQMADAITIEGIWANQGNVPGGTFRNVENTTKIIENVREVLDAGVSISFLNTQYEGNSNYFDVDTVTEVVHDGESKLLVKLNQEHHIWPHGGAPFERFRLRDLPAEYQGLADVQWTAVEVAGKPDHVILEHRFKSLGEIKKSNGVSGHVQFQGGELGDLQAETRLNAALATLLRRPGDKIFVDYSPGNPPPGGGDPNHPDNWWYWPKQLGAPIADYVIDSTESTGEIVHMYREFENGVLHIYPNEGYVDLQLNTTPALA